MRNYFISTQLPYSSAHTRAAMSSQLQYRKTARQTSLHRRPGDASVFRRTQGPQVSGCACLHFLREQSWLWRAWPAWRISKCLVSPLRSPKKRMSGQHHYHLQYNNDSERSSAACHTTRQSNSSGRRSVSGHIRQPNSSGRRSVSGHTRQLNSRGRRSVSCYTRQLNLAGLLLST